MRYRTQFKQTIDTWEDGYRIVQIVTPEETDDTQLRFCYQKDGEFVNRSLTVAPTQRVAEKPAR